MDNGTVHSQLYDTIKYNAKSNGIIVEVDEWIDSTVDLNIKKFSKSDIEALELVIEKYKYYTSTELINETHKDNLWKEYHKYGTSNDIPTNAMIEHIKQKEYINFWNKEIDHFNNWLENVTGS